MKNSLLVTIVAFGSLLVFAQQRQGQTAPGTGMQKPASGSTSEACTQMMAKREQMRADMKRMDAELDQKLAAMNAATGPAKVDAMANVLNEMVSDRKKMQQNMMTMHSDMMRHMGAHMMAGKESVMNCPMMKGGPASKPGVS